MHEILTLQFGSYASHISSHYWNLQSSTSSYHLKQLQHNQHHTPETDATVLFRRGEDPRTGQVLSYNPRVLVFNRRRDMGLMSANAASSLSTISQSDVPAALNAKDYIRKQYEALTKGGSGGGGGDIDYQQQQDTWTMGQPEIWLQRRQENDTTQYNLNLNKMPSAQQWNSLLGENLVQESLNNEDQIPEELRENPGDWASFHRWNQKDMELRQQDDEEGKDSQQQQQSAHQMLQNSADDKKHLEKIRSELHQNVHTWSDFLEPLLHPKSLCPVQDELAFYNDYGSQTKTLLEEEYMDRVRFFLEECDYVQGFQMLVDSNDGWASVATQMVDQIRDDIGTKKTILAFTCADVTPPQMEDSAMVDLSINMAMGMSDLYERVDMVVPLTAFQCSENNFPMMHLEQNSQYHTSALLASMLDNATVPYRKFKNSREMFRVVQDLQPRASHRISALSGTLPLPLYEKQTLFDFYKELDSIHASPYFSTLSPYNRASHHAPPLAQNVVVRGINDVKIPLYESNPESSGASAIKDALSVDDIRNQIQALMRANNVGGRSRASKRDTPYDREDSILGHCDSHEEMLSKYLDQTRTYNTNHEIISDPIHLSPSYPSVFSERELTSHGLRRKSHLADDEHAPAVSSIPCISQWETTGGMVPYMRRLTKIIKQCHLRSGRAKIGLTKDQLIEREETLNQAADDYEVDEDDY